MLAKWWLKVFESPASGVFKLVITEVRNFPDIADYYFREVVDPGHKLIGSVIRRGIESGEFRRVNIEAAVHSLVLPMVMLCLHKHSLGVCAPVQGLVQPREFIAQHMELVIRGLLAPVPKARRPAAARRKVTR
jgi:hypothetical protein